MIIDNSELIKSLLWFPEFDTKAQENGEPSQAPKLFKGEHTCQEDYFYVVQLLQRAKDNPTKWFGNPNFRNNSNRTIQQFQIYSLKDFEMKLPVIIDMAQYYQARAYINVNLKCSFDVYNEMFKNLAARHITGNYTKLHRLFNEAVGEAKTASCASKRWLVDIDTKEPTVKADIRAYIESLRGNGKNSCGEVLAEIPTKNGVHLITTSFDMHSFSKAYPTLDVHKDNPTILYYNDEWKIQGQL